MIPEKNVSLHEKCNIVHTSISAKTRRISRIDRHPESNLVAIAIWGQNELFFESLTLPGIQKIILVKILINFSRQQSNCDRWLKFSYEKTWDLVWTGFGVGDRNFDDLFTTSFGLD
jgi:hypothetical protein